MRSPVTRGRRGADSQHGGPSAPRSPPPPVEAGRSCTSLRCLSRVVRITGQGLNRRHLSFRVQSSLSLAAPAGRGCFLGPCRFHGSRPRCGFCCLSSSHGEAGPVGSHRKGQKRLLNNVWVALRSRGGSGQKPRLQATIFGDSPSHWVTVPSPARCRLREKA